MQQGAINIAIAQTTKTPPAPAPDKNRPRPFWAVPHPPARGPRAVASTWAARLPAKNGPRASDSSESSANCNAVCLVIATSILFWLQHICVCTGCLERQVRNTTETEKGIA